MLYFDSQLLSVDGHLNNSGASYSISLDDFVYCILSKANDSTGALVETFLCVIENQNKSRTITVQYKRNSRTMADFFADINAIGGGQPLKLWTNMRSFSNNTLLATDLLYDSSFILNDNYQNNCLYSTTLNITSAYISSNSDTTPIIFTCVGNQIESAPLYEDVVLNVYDGLIANGTTEATTTILNYGMNVVETATATDYAVKLPQPKTGKSVKVMNKSTTTIYLFPSNIGGQINNLAIDEPAIVPNDGNLYEFVCIENPLPGAWTWSAPAINQYDSGDITANITLGLNGTIHCTSPSNAVETGGFSSSTGFSYDGKSKAMVVFGAGSVPMFKPQYNAIAKVKVYTNLSANNGGILWQVGNSSQKNHYNISTGAFITNGVTGGAYGGYGFCDQTVPGATLGLNALATNIGDPGTCWGELVLVGAGSNFASGVDSRIGDHNLGIVANPLAPAPPATVRQWLTGYINFQIQPRVNLTGFMFRFFIEYY